MLPKKQDGPLLPHAPQLPARDRELHPQAVQAISAYSTALETVEQLTADLKKMSNDLVIERRHNASLRAALTKLQEDRDYYYRYAAELRTSLGNITMIMMQAEKKAQEMANRPPPQVVEEEELIADKDLKEVVSSLEAEISGINVGHVRNSTVAPTNHPPRQ